MCTNYLNDFHIFSPFPQFYGRDILNEYFTNELFVFRFAGFENAYSTSTKLWNVDTLDSVLLPLFDLNHTHIDILFIDLQGGEWDVLECLLKSDALSVSKDLLKLVVI